MNTTQTIKVGKSLASVIAVDVIEAFDLDTDAPLSPIVEAWTGSALTSPSDAPARASLRMALIELSNRQDEIANDSSMPAEERTIARAAMRSIETTLDKLRSA